MTTEGRRESAAEELDLAAEELRVAEQLLETGHDRGAREELAAARSLVEAIGEELAAHDGEAPRG